VTETVLSFEHVSAWYGSAQALFNIDLEVRKGEVVGLLGRNGAGKSTTFKSIINTEVRHDGQIVVLGRPTGRAPTDVIVRRGVGWVPEDRRIFQSLSVSENLRLAQAASRDRSPVSIPELIEAFPLLEKLLGRRGGHLSGGEQQVVSIARALAFRPRLLLLDEPTEGLAPVVVHALEGSIAEIPERFGVTVLIAEQALDFALRLSSRVYVLESGRVVYSGTSEEFGQERTLQRRFLSVAAAQDDTNVAARDD
jgi:branched-chain amino acid transport system ATP-binding protein